MAHAHFNIMHGVYIIWHGGLDPKTVRVGQGFIRERLGEHRNDPAIQAYASFGLYVTWASVEQSSLNGVEAFLANQLRPLIGERFPDAPHIAVRLPW